MTDKCDWCISTDVLNDYIEVAGKDIEEVIDETITVLGEYLSTTDVKEAVDELSDMLSCCTAYTAKKIGFEEKAKDKEFLEDALKRLVF